MAIRVNGELIEDERFHRAFLDLSGGRTPQQVQQHAPYEFQTTLQQAEQNVLRSVLLLQFATAEGIAATREEVDEERRTAWGSAANQSCGTGVTADMERRVTVRKAERYLARHVPRPDRRGVEAAYRNNPSAFALPERWLVSHIVKFAESDVERTEAMEALTLAAGELKRGKPFASIAERYSDCKGSGGSLGWIRRGSMVAEFEDVVFRLRRRVVSDIFATQFGLHIAIVNDSKAAGLQPLEDVRAELARRIFEDGKAHVIDQAVADLYRRATLEVVHETDRSVAAGEKVQ